MLQLHEQKLQQRNLLVNFERISQFRFRRRLKTSFQKFTFLVDSVLRQCKNKMLTKGQCSNLSVNVNEVKLHVWLVLLQYLFGNYCCRPSRPLGIVSFQNLSSQYLYFPIIHTHAHGRSHSEGFYEDPEELGVDETLKGCCPRGISPMDL